MSFTACSWSINIKHVWGLSWILFPITFNNLHGQNETNSSYQLTQLIYYHDADEIHLCENVYNYVTMRTVFSLVRLLGFPGHSSYLILFSHILLCIIWNKSTTTTTTSKGFTCISIPKLYLIWSFWLLLLSILCW